MRRCGRSGKPIAHGVEKGEGEEKAGEIPHHHAELGRRHEGAKERQSDVAVCGDSSSSKAAEARVTRGEGEGGSGSMGLKRVPGGFGRRI